MIQLLELVDRDFKATIISILKNLQEKMNVMQGDMEQQGEKVEKEPSENCGTEKYNICRKGINELKNMLI